MLGFCGLLRKSKGEAEVVDINAGGVGLRAIHGLHLGQEVELLLDIPVYPERLMARGTVCWTSFLGPDEGMLVPPRLGVTFSKLSGADVARLQALQDDPVRRIVGRESQPLA
jgi:Tfp pilus assembly protein PilZ